MKCYDKIKHAFSENINEYNQLSTTQEKVKQQLISKVSQLANTSVSCKLLNIGIRDIDEPIQLKKVLNVQSIDAIDISLQNIKSSDSTINLYEMNFDKDLQGLDKKYEIIFINGNKNNKLNSNRVL